MPYSISTGGCASTKRPSTALKSRFRQFDVDSTVEIEMSSQQFNANPVLHIEYSGILNPEEDKAVSRCWRGFRTTALFCCMAESGFPQMACIATRPICGLRSRLRPVGRWSPIFRSREMGMRALPSYWGTVAAGKYNSTNVKTEKAEISISTLKASADVVSPMAETVGKIFDFYTEKFGPPPSPNFRIVEVSGANWPSQWSVGMLLLPSAGIRKDFDQDALASSVAHQWFPLKFAVKDPSTDAWLVDGMAQFASLFYFEKTLAPVDAQDPHPYRAGQGARIRRQFHDSTGGKPGQRYARLSGAGSVPRGLHPPYVEVGYRR